MMSSSVTPLIEEKGADVDRVEGVGGVAALECLERNYALLRLTVLASIAPMTRKGPEEGKRTSKWCKSHVIAEGKMGLSRFVVSL